MKKLIIIALLTFTVNAMYAQGQKVTERKSTSTNDGIANPNSWSNENPSQPIVHPTRNTGVEAPVAAPKKATPVATNSTSTQNMNGTPSSTTRPLTAEEIRIQKTIQSGTPGRR